MKKILLALLAVFSFQACDRGVEAPRHPDKELVSISPRLVRTESVPVPVFLGTDRVRVSVTSSNSPFAFSQVVSFADRALDVPGVPRTAMIEIRVEGLDPQANVIWSGTSGAFLASIAETGVVSIPFTRSEPVPYLTGTSWLWEEGSSSDTAVEWLNLNDDGTFDRLFTRWVERGTIARRDTFAGVYEYGSYQQVGQALVLRVESSRTCFYRGSLQNECGTNGPNWLDVSDTVYTLPLEMVGTSTLVLDQYRYRTSPSVKVNALPPRFAPSTWEYSQTFADPVGAIAAELDVLENGTFERRTVLVALGLTSAIVQRGTWVGNSEAMAFTPTFQSACTGTGSSLDCADPSSYPEVSPDGSETYLWGTDGTNLVFYDLADSSVVEAWTAR